MPGLGELDELYEEIILDHYRNPRNNEELDDPDAEIEANNPFCGDEVKIQLRFQDGRVNGVGVTGRGCAISKSSASLLSELAEGRTQGELSRTTNLVRRMMRDESLTEEELDDLGDLEALRGVRKYPVRIKCALLSWAAPSGRFGVLRAKVGGGSLKAAPRCPRPALRHPA